ncbi:hypothetical protein [Actinomyces minihominis]|uniref:hypothetical protein n=1 Tax=Actinomyces minihominis TaxID=2002838 RepID=UPI000C076A27|nr:hypothetical protein [Actinomyces minihominis]
MSKIKRYSLPIVLGIIALALTVVGILGLTVWKPAQQVQATYEGNQPLVMTRAGVLPLYAEKVNIKATADPDQEVWVALGLPEDVTAWLQDEPYDEIVGLTDLQTLKTIPHIIDTEVQSGGEDEAEEEVAEQAQSGDSPTSPLSSDMWVAEKFGRGSVSLTITGDELGMSILAATDGVGAAPSITLTWETPQPNTTATIAFIAAGVVAVVALILALALVGSRRRRVQRSEEIRTLDERASTETTEIAVIDPNAEVVEQQVGAGTPAEEVPVEVDVADEGDEVAEPIEAEDVAKDETDPIAGEVVAVETPEQLEEPEVEEQPENAKSESNETRDGLRTETVTTDSGMMNLAALQAGGGAFPTRRALRDAQKRGVSRLVVGDREFSTENARAKRSSTPDEVLSERSLRPGKWNQAMGQQDK